MEAKDIIHPEDAKAIKAIKGIPGLEKAIACFMKFGFEQQFCLAANFPNLATFRLFKRFNPEQYSFYIDAGNITLKNPKTAVLIGKTTATIKCDTCENHTVITMHGASATVLASGWAVVRTEAGVSTNIIRRTSDNAIIL